MADNEIRKPADGIDAGQEHEVQISLDAPQRPRIRRMTEEETNAWSRGVHRACSVQVGIPALRYGYTNLMPFVDEQCSTAYTDCHFRIGLSPDILDPEKTTDDQRAVVIMHETLHNIHRHNVRFGKRGLPQILVNYVTDLEINSVLAEGVCGIRLNGKINPNDHSQHWERLIGGVRKLEEEDEVEALNASYNNADNPLKVGDYIYEGALLPTIGKFWDLPANLTAEQYLALLEWDNISEEDYMSQMSSQPGTEGEDGEEGDGQGTGEGAGQDGEEQDGPSGGPGQEQEDGGDSSGQQDGSGKTVTVKATRRYGGGTRIWQDHADGTSTELVQQDNWVDEVHLDGEMDPSIWDQVDAMGIHPIDRGFENKIREQIAHDIEEEKTTNQHGRDPMMQVLNYIAKGLRPPIVDWRKMLRQVTSKASQDMTAGRQDYTYRKRRRRSGGPVSGYPSRTEVIYPGLMAYTPKIRFALDTSGSMSKNEYRKALSEVEGILREIRSDLEFVSVDAQAATPIKVHTMEELTSHMLGGGGTDMRAALAQVADEKPGNRPDVLIIATDGGYFWREYIEAMKMKGLEKTAVITLLVYKFDEDRYYNEQSNIQATAHELRKAKKDSYLVQAWV